MLYYNNKLIPRAKEMRKNMTREEKILWYDFLKNYPVKFYRQKVIGNYIVDFYCSKAKLIIEIDGDRHLQERDSEYDIMRTAYMEGLNLKTLRFTNTQLENNMKSVFAQIENKVNSRIYMSD